MSDYVLYQLRLSNELDAKLRKRMELLVDSHNKTITKLATGNITPKQTTALQDAHRTTKRMTIHNLMRFCLEQGLVKTEHIKDTDVINDMAARGVMRGRPGGQ